MPRCQSVQLTRTGWDHDLVSVHGPDDPPAAHGDRVVVALEASGVCHRDLIDREGRIPFLQLPVVPGHEGVGHVIAVGPRATTWAVGDRVATLHRDACGDCGPCRAGDTSLCASAAHVLGLLADGTYGRHLVAPESALYRVPEDLPVALAAPLHCTFGTAWRSLVTVGGLQAGERVLITGANGGVGQAAVQVAARFGAEVVAVVRDGRHGQRLQSLGATRVIVSPDSDFHRGEVVGMDLALDCVGTPTFHPALKTLRVGGRIAVVGNVTPQRAQLNLGLLIVMGLRILGAGGATRADMAAVLAAHAERPFSAAIDRTLPLAQADAAQRLVRAGGLAGRVLLIP